MGEYAYELIGGVLIVVSSLVGEQMQRRWKIRSYATFVLIAIAFSGIGIHVRREAAATDRAERQERKEEIIGLRNDMSKMLATFDELARGIGSVHRDLEAAGGERDPRARAELENKAKAAQQTIGDSYRGLFIALVPGTAKQLRSFQGDWNSPEGRTLITNADYLRRGILQLLHETAEDRTAAGLFTLQPGGYVNWNAQEAARYLELLATRTKVVLPPTITSIEVK